MPRPLHEMSSFSPSAQPSRAPEDDWESTRAQGADPKTQVLRDKEDYLANAPKDIGRHVGAGQWELFIVSAPAEAMQMQFEHQRPEYIAIHDIGTSSSRRLLAGLAAAASSSVQKLVIRRQGYGMSLATIEFVELPVPGGAPLRLYTTEIDADTHSRHDLARVLLGHSRLAVVMVGELPPHAIAGALQPLSEAMTAGPWLNRHLLVLPLSSGNALAAQAAQLGTGRGVEVRTTPQVTRPAEAWSFISSTWNRLREQVAASGVALPIIGAAATPSRRASDPPVAPLPMQPMPEVPRPGAAPVAAAATPLAAYVQKCIDLKGMVSCCAFEVATQRPVAHAGNRPGPAALAAQGAAMFAAIAESGRQLGAGPGPIDAAITLAAHHLLLRAIPGHPGMALHAVLDRHGTNLTLVRLQLQRLDETLAPAG